MLFVVVWPKEELAAKGERVQLLCTTVARTSQNSEIIINPYRGACMIQRCGEVSLDLKRKTQRRKAAGVGSLRQKTS